jgi:hypothetical protein
VRKLGVKVGKRVKVKERETTSMEGSIHERTLCKFSHPLPNLPIQRLFYRLPYLRRLTSISSLSNLHELCLDMCDLTTLPTLPLNLRRLSASDNSISNIDDAWEGEGEIMLEYVDLRGNLLKEVPGIMKGERMKKLKTARLDGCEIKVDELVKFSMEFKIKLC